MKKYIITYDNDGGTFFKLEDAGHELKGFCYCAFNPDSDNSYRNLEDNARYLGIDFHPFRDSIDPEDFACYQWIENARDILSSARQFIEDEELEDGMVEFEISTPEAIKKALIFLEANDALEIEIEIESEVQEAISHAEYDRCDKLSDEEIKAIRDEAEKKRAKLELDKMNDRYYWAHRRTEDALDKLED